ADPVINSITLDVNGPAGQRTATLNLPAAPAYMNSGLQLANRLPKQVIPGLAVALGFVGLLTIFGNGVRYFQEYYSDKAATLAVNDIRRKLYDHVLHIPLGFFGMK